MIRDYLRFTVIPEITRITGSPDLEIVYQVLETAAKYDPNEEEEESTLSTISPQWTLAARQPLMMGYERSYPSVNEMEALAEVVDTPSYAGGVLKRKEASIYGVTMESVGAGPQQEFGPYRRPEDHLPPSSATETMMGPPSMVYSHYTERYPQGKRSRIDGSVAGTEASSARSTAGLSDRTCDECNITFKFPRDLKSVITPPPFDRKANMRTAPTTKRHIKGAFIVGCATRNFPTNSV